MQKRFSHEIVVDRSLAETFPLFTPKGEEAWVPGWAPTYLRPESGEICKEMVFTTGDGDEKTFWTCLALEPDRGHVRYLRLTPASRLAFVDVQCRPDGATRTRVRVEYDMLALTDEGRAHLIDLTPAAFARSIDQWAELIRSMR